MGFMDYQRSGDAEHSDGVMGVVAIALALNTVLLALILWRVW